jgi:hypothetical protein
MIWNGYRKLNSLIWPVFRNDTDAMPSLVVLSYAFHQRLRIGCGNSIPGCIGYVKNMSAWEDGLIGSGAIVVKGSHF